VQRPGWGFWKDRGDGDARAALCLLRDVANITLTDPAVPLRAAFELDRTVAETAAIVRSIGVDIRPQFTTRYAMNDPTRIGAATTSRPRPESSRCARRRRTDASWGLD
jgi:hypothetical protein